MTSTTSPTGCPISHNAAAFSPFEGPYQDDPAQSLEWARLNEPVFYAPQLGYWVVTKYEDVKAVFRDPIVFSASIALEKVTPAPPEAAGILKKYGFNLQRTMVNEDEPQHMERRRLLLEAFLPENLIKHEASIRALTRDYMDRFIADGQADLVTQMFSEIPLTVALHFLGVPDEGADKLRKFAVAHTLNTWGRPTPTEQLEITESVGQFWQVANETLDMMWTDPTGEGWMYDSIRAHMAHPDAVPESYLRSMMMAILAAAHETTSNATSNMFWTLLSDRSAWDALCENPALVPSAVEECLRVAGSIVAWRRIATRETQVGGVKIPEGGKLMIVQASANKDASYWENADLVDIYRDNAADHMSFGYGAHQCMGKNIARMQMRIFLDEFIHRLPHLELAPNQTFENLPNMSFRGPQNLFVQWDPAGNPSPQTKCDTSFKIGAPAKDDILRNVVATQVMREADGIITVTLSSPDGRALPRWSAGAHIDLVADGIRRKYSLCGNADDKRNWQIAIQREGHGRGGSIHFHGTIKQGSRVQVAGPKNHFKLNDSADDYVLIAGGIGITPMIAMADRLKQSGKPYKLYYCSASRGRMALLNRAITDHDASIHVSDEGTRLDLGDMLRAPASELQIYACGPARMLEELETLGSDWPDGTLHIERFSVGSSVLDPENERAFLVELVDSGLEIEVPQDQTLLDALGAAGIDVPCDCNEGLCGTCEVAVLSGDIDHRDHVLSTSERKASDRIMACCSRARSGKLRLAL